MGSPISGSATPAALADRSFVSYITTITIDWVFLALVSFVVLMVLALYRTVPGQKEYLVIAVCGGFELLHAGMHLLYVRLRLPFSGTVFSISMLAMFIFWALRYEVVLRLVGVRPAPWIRVLQGLLIGTWVFYFFESVALNECGHCSRRE
jgi:hypothetical protein